MDHNSGLKSFSQLFATVLLGMFLRVFQLCAPKAMFLGLGWLQWSYKLRHFVVSYLMCISEVLKKKDKNETLRALKARASEILKHSSTLKGGEHYKRKSLQAAIQSAAAQAENASDRDSGDNWKWKSLLVLLYQFLRIIFKCNKGISICLMDLFIVITGQAAAGSAIFRWLFYVSWYTTSKKRNIWKA